MPSTLVSENYTNLVKIVISLICGNEGVSLTDFSNQLEKLIKQLNEYGVKVEELNKLLIAIAQALKVNDLIQLLDIVYSISTYEGVKIIAKAE